MGVCPGQVKWISTPDNQITSNAASKLTSPKYSLFGERIRHVTPATLQCSMFCGGRECKYCNPKQKFKKAEMTINGLYSAWVTDKILATSRPSTQAIKQFDIIKQFKNHGINSIINLQHAGEHAACGFGLESGGFSYISKDFMDNDIFYYNFGWNDYGVRSLQSILDMVQVMDFAISKGKVAVHCHAGLGRTGVLIACYIIFSQRCTAAEAIRKVRQARSKSIQTRGQINCVKDFASYIKPMWIIFPEEGSRVTLKRFLQRQRRLMHGEEARTMRYIPKIIFTILKCFLQLAHVKYDLSECVKITHYSFMQNCHLSSTQDTKTQDTRSMEDMKMQPKDDTLDMNVSPTNSEGNKYLDGDILNLEKEKTTLSLPSCSISNELEAQLKATSMPNVGMSSSCDESSLLKLNHHHILLEPIDHLRRKNLQKFALNLSMSEKYEELSLSSSLNSYSTLSSPVPLGSSLDSSVLNGMMLSRCDTASTLCDASTNGFTEGEEIMKYLAFRSSDINTSNQVERYKRKLNASECAYEELDNEIDLAVLCGLFWLWLNQLQKPLISAKHVELMRENMDNPGSAAEHFEKEEWKLMEAFITCVSKLNGRCEDVNRALRRFAVCLSGDESIPRMKYSKANMVTELVGDESSGLILFKFLLCWLNQLQSNQYCCSA